jgi:hypothetical protein
MIQKRLVDLKRGDLIYLDHRLLAAGSFRLPACFDQFRDDNIAMIALNFDDAFAHRSTGAAAFLEFCRERFKIRQRQRYTPNGRDAFAGPALSFASNPYGARFGSTGNSFGTHALTHRPPAIGAQAANAGRIDDARAHGDYRAEKNVSLLDGRIPDRSCITNA